MVTLAGNDRSSFIARSLHLVFRLASFASGLFLKQTLHVGEKMTQFIAKKMIACMCIEIAINCCKLPLSVAVGRGRNWFVRALHFGGL